MSFATALKLSFTNIKTKKGRTALTAFASSIGIVGIATIMSLSSGFQEQINKFQSDSFASFPIMITQENSQIDIEKMQGRQKELMGVTTSEDSYPDTNEVYSYSSEEYVVTHKNIFTDEYIEYVENIDPTYVQSIGYTRLVGLKNDEYYVYTNMGVYTVNTDYETMFNSENTVDLKITGIIRAKEDSGLALLSAWIAYSDELSQYIIDNALESDIVKAQEKVNYNVLSYEQMDEATKEQVLSYLGGNTTPYMISIYPTDFDNKDAVVDYLDDYNEGKSEEDKIIYTDLADQIMSMTDGIMTGITVVLIAFAGISLVVSLIMIGIITYTSVLERTKEIGILKALGASKKDITRVFDAETCILGIFSGVLGICIAYGLTFPINSIIYKMTDLENVAQLPIIYAIILVAISTILTMLGGHIPARMASKKDAVEALRSE